jgi:multiple sugar transport system permease protein/cellobiose transport system permease protein
MMQQQRLNSGRRFSVKKVNRMGYVFILPFFAFFLVFNLYPILYSLWLSFYNWNGIGRRTFVGINNYVQLLTTDPYFYRSVGNTFIFLFGYLPAAVILGLLIATLLYNKHIKNASFFQTAQFLPYIIASVCIAMLFRVLFDWSTGMVNLILVKLGLLKEGINWLGDPKLARLVVIMLMIWKELGYVVTLFLAGMTNVSPELLEAGEVDGANYIQKLTRIIIPQLKPIILFVVITGTIECLQVFDAPHVLFAYGAAYTSAGGPGRAGLTGIWYMMDTAFGQSSGMPAMGYGAAVAYSLFIIIVVFSIFNFKVINKGVDE